MLKVLDSLSVDRLKLFLSVLFSVCGVVCCGSFCNSVPGVFGYCYPVNFTSRIVPPSNSVVCDVINSKYCNHETFVASDTNPSDYFFYIFLDSLPVLILVPLILFFNINLASGPGQSLVFMYLSLVALNTAGGGPYCPPVLPSTGCKYDNLSNWGLLSLLVAGFLVFYNAPLKYFLHTPTVVTITNLSLDYVKILIAGVMVVLYLFLATCSQCPVQCCRSCWAKLRRSVRNWRERHLPERPVFTGACSVALLMYGMLVQVSFRLLYKQVAFEEVCVCTSDNTHRYAFCSEHTGTSDFLCWGSPAHMPYFVIAWIFIGVAVLLSLPFFYHPGVPALVSYLTRGRVQLPRLHRLEPLLDVFQGAYKPKRQFFSGLHLLYRIGLFSTVAFGVGHSDSVSIFLFVSITILTVHSVCQPYKNSMNNYLETLLLVNTTLVNVSVVTFPTWAVFSLVPLLVNFPLLCVIIHYLRKFTSRFCCSQQKMYGGLMSERDLGESDSFVEDRWVPHS